MWTSFLMKKTICLLYFLLPVIVSAQIKGSEMMSLETALALASLQNSGLVKDGLERQTARRQLALQARQFFPDLELGYIKNDSVTRGSSDSRVKKLSLGINQLLFSGGKTLAAYRNARMQLDLKDYLSLSAENSVANQVTLQFVDILKNRRILEIQKQSFENLSRQVEIASLEHQLGQIRAVDYLDIKLAASSFFLTIEDTKKNLIAGRYSLSTLLYIPLEQLPELSGRLNRDYQGIFTKLAEEEAFIPMMQANAEKKNQQLLNLNREEVMARQELRNSRLIWLPRIEATGNFSLSGEEYPLNEPAFSLGLNFQFNLPLLPSSVDLQAGRSNRDEHNRALSSSTDVMDNLEGVLDKQTAQNSLYLKQLEKEEVRRSVFFQVCSLSQDILLITDRISTQREKLAILEEKLKINEAELNLGQMTRLAYVESEIDLAQERISLLESLTSLYGLEEQLKTLCSFTSPAENKESLIHD